MSVSAVQQNRAVWPIGAALAAAVVSPWLPLESAALLIVGLFVLLLSWHDPIWAPALAVLSVPIQDLIALPGGLSVTQALLPLLVFSFLRHSRHEPFTRQSAVLAAFVWILALSAGLTPYSRTDGLAQTARWGVVLLSFVAGQAALRGPTARRRAVVLIAAVLTAPLLSALLGIVQYQYGLGPASFAIGDGHSRAFGTIGQPNSFAGYLNHSWPLGLGLLLAWLTQARRTRTAQHGGIGLLLFATTALIGGGLLVSFSRGGWLGAAVGLSAAVIVIVGRLDAMQRRRAGQLIAAAALALVLISVGGLLPTAFESRLQSLVSALQPLDIRNTDITDDNFAVVERTAHLQAALAMVRERPLLGIGPGNYNRVYERSDSREQPAIWIRPWSESRGHAHNYYLQIAAEAGLLGLAAYLALLISLLRRMWSGLDHVHDWLGRGCVIGGISMLAAVSGHNLFENLHVLNIGIQFAAVAALATAQPWSSAEGASQ